MTSSRTTKQRKSRELDKARDDYDDARALSELAEANAESARNVANAALWRWTNMLESIASRALKGK